ncbi:unnamed protein product [Anisakis simplex]|uniref:Uncharacterized protein n=1 Tax=Anisakis simplex TaxID=6269 RepID=A0A3P6PEH7_ANISI|nr:unnamed protein product [Anisakis simplex]
MKETSSSITRTVSAAFNNLYYPVNTPSCQYQKQLIIESLFYNLLIALPKEFDSFFVASVVMINFRRWFPQKKVVYIGVTLEMIRNMVCVFMDITGCDRRDICVYGDQKKSDRFAEWNNCGIVFATAEVSVVPLSCNCRCVVLMHITHSNIDSDNNICNIFIMTMFVQK